MKKGQCRLAKCSVCHVMGRIQGREMCCKCYKRDWATRSLANAKRRSKRDDKVRQQEREWYARNRSLVSERRRQRYKEDAEYRERMLAQQKERYRNSPEERARALGCSRAWKLRNPERLRKQRERAVAKRREREQRGPWPIIKQSREMRRQRQKDWERSNKERISENRKRWGAANQERVTHNKNRWNVVQHTSLRLRDVPEDFIQANMRLAEFKRAIRRMKNGSAA